ncbi:MAG: 2OG-Fe(II) oxygenase [Opitutaceae bacterium]
MSYGEGGHFGTWHTDTGSEHARFRKISASIELSERSCFDGGNLEIYPHSLGETLRVQQGGGAFFPSFVPHRVTSIRQGQRYSLVNWISGPPYEVDVAQKFMGGRTNSR